MPVAPPPAPASAPPRPAAAGAPACKLCVVGMPGVGKSSLVQRLLHGRYPAPPLPPGITVQAHRFAAPDGGEFSATLWDVAASSAIDTLGQAFLSRLDGVAAIAAPDVPDSVPRALELLERIRALHPGTPALLLFNKIDLGAPPRPSVPAELGWREVSARDDLGVASAFGELALRAATRR